MNMPLPTPGGKIFAAISAIIAEVATVPKGSTNKQQGFQYRSADDICDALHGAQGKHKVFSTCQIVSREMSERQTKNGAAMFYVSLRCIYTFHAEDGSSVSTETWGEAMDMADKATNKAMTAAYKYALLQVFCLMGHGDADEVTPEPTIPQTQQYGDYPTNGNGNGGGGGKAKPACPNCGGTDSVMTNKGGGGWSCWKSKGGCEHKWAEGDPPPNKSQPTQSDDAGTNAALFDKMAATLKTVKDRGAWRDRVTDNYDLRKIDLEQLKSLMNLNIAMVGDDHEAELIHEWIFNVAAGVKPDDALNVQMNLLKAKRATLQPA